MVRWWWDISGMSLFHEWSHSTATLHSLSLPCLYYQSRRPVSSTSLICNFHLHKSWSFGLVCAMPNNCEHLSISTRPFKIRHSSALSLSTLLHVEPALQPYWSSWGSHEILFSLNSASEHKDMSPTPTPALAAHQGEAMMSKIGLTLQDLLVDNQKTVAQLSQIYVPSLRFTDSKKSGPSLFI